MVANIVFLIVYFVVLLNPAFKTASIPTLGAGVLLRCTVAIFVCFGLGWARVSFIFFSIFGILTSVVPLLSDCLITARNEQVGRQTPAGHTMLLVVFPLIRIALAIFTLWVLARAENVRDFFFQKKYGHS